MAENAAANEEEQPIIVKKIIKKAGHGGAHGGAWKVAYADFVTAMMCLFLLLWLINVDPSSKSAVAEFFRQPTQTGPQEGNVFVFGGAKNPSQPGRFEGGASVFQFEKLKLTGKNKEEVMKKITMELKKSMEITADEELYEKMHLSLTENGILIEINDNAKEALFDSGSSVLTANATEILDKLTNSLRDKYSKVIIAGYTDKKKFDLSSYDNWNLSTDRANSVRKRMLYSGLDPRRVIRVEGYGDTQLKLPDAPLAALNRRITILLLQEDKEDIVDPKYLNPEDALPHLSEEKSKLAKVKKSSLKSNIKHNDSKSIISSIKEKRKYSSPTAGIDEKPPSLEELRRRKETNSTNNGGGH